MYLPNIYTTGKCLFYLTIRQFNRLAASVSIVCLTGRYTGGGGGGGGGGTYWFQQNVLPRLAPKLTKAGNLDSPAELILI